MARPSMNHIIYQDQNILLVEKLGGWLSVPGREGRNEQRDCLSFWLEERLNLRLYPCHRLDREVSGLIIYAKNEKAHRLINIGFEKHTIFKTYQALSQQKSNLPFAPFEWKNLLVKGKKRAFEAPHGKTSITKVGRVSLGKWKNLDVSLWELHPITGRSHQLRVHMSNAGFPILGDKLYGDTSEFGPSEIALRAYRIDLPENIQSELQLPSHFEIQPFLEFS